jgi:hypothetical protein
MVVPASKHLKSLFAPFRKGGMGDLNESIFRLN